MPAPKFKLFQPTLTDLDVPTSPSRRDGPDEVYARRMRTVLRNGYPIRDAKPFVDATGAVHDISLGDVCYFDEGCLRRLWNIIFPERNTEDESPGTDVCPSFRDEFPDFYAPKSLKMRIGAPTPYLGPGYHESKGDTRKDTGAGFSAPALSTNLGGNIKFTFENHEGAILLLPEPAYKQSLGRDAMLRKYIAAHGPSMYDFVKGELELELRMEDLIFVTGTVKAGAWDTWTITEASSGNSVSFDLSAPNTIGASLEWTRSFDDACSPAYAWGPADRPPAPPITSDAVSSRLGYDSAAESSRSSFTSASVQHDTASHPPSISDLGSPSSAVMPLPPLSSTGGSQHLSGPHGDQCLLVAGYKFKRRFGAFLKSIRGGAGPWSLKQDRDYDDDPDDFSIQPPYHPLDTLLSYILSDEDVDLAIAHDEDLDVLFPESEGILPEDLEAALFDKAPRIHVNEDKVGSIDPSPQTIVPSLGPAANSAFYAALGETEGTNTSWQQRMRERTERQARKGADKQPARDASKSTQSEVDRLFENAQQQAEEEPAVPPPKFVYVTAPSPKLPAPVAPVATGSSVKSPAAVSSSSSAEGSSAQLVSTSTAQGNTEAGVKPTGSDFDFDAVD